MFQQPANCPGKTFYTYTAFLRAASFYPSFGTHSTPARNKREVAAFLAQISAETFGMYVWATHLHTLVTTSSQAADGWALLVAGG